MGVAVKRWSGRPVHRNSLLSAPRPPQGFRTLHWSWPRSVPCPHGDRRGLGVSLLTSTLQRDWHVTKLRFVESCIKPCDFLLCP